MICAWFTRTLRESVGSRAITTYRRLRDSVSQYFRKRDRRGRKGGSGYGRVRVRRSRVVRAEKGSKMCFPPCGSYSLYREDFYREARIEGSWDVIGSNVTSGRLINGAIFDSLIINNNDVFESLGQFRRNAKSEDMTWLMIKTRSWKFRYEWAMLKNWEKRILQLILQLKMQTKYDLDSYL